MKSLIVSAITPPIPGWDEHGIYRRLAMFVRAIGRVAGHIHMLHMVPRSFMDANPDWEVLGETLSAHWRTRVTVSLVPIVQRRETVWSHYVAGSLWAGWLPTFCRFTGPAQVAAVRAALDTNPDLVFVHRLTAMHAVLRSGRRPARLFFDLDDVEHRVTRRAALQPPFWAAKLAYVGHVLALMRSERQAIARARATFVCSEADVKLLRRLFIGNRVQTIPNSVPMPARLAPPVDRQVLLHIGDYSYGPNAQAADRLVQRIWPLVRARCPAARLIIAGRMPNLLRCFSAAPDGTSFPGFVRSLPQLYAETRVVCCPLLLGGGTRLKLIEAAAFAKPMVSTRLGAEGLAFRDGEEILLRDDDTEFAEACIMLLHDDAACRRLGEAARAKAAALYDVAVIEQRIASILMTA